jgi:hypothetical protein
MNARSVLGCVALSLLACAAGDDTMISASTSPLGDTTDATTMPGSESGSTQSTTMPDSSGTAEESSTSSMPGNTVLFETTLGDIVIELDPELAPITVENFFAYVDAGFYDGSDGMGATTFHRVVAGFVIQGGGVTEAGGLKPTMSPIVNEFGQRDVAVLHQPRRQPGSRHPARLRRVRPGRRRPRRRGCHRGHADHERGARRAHRDHGGHAAVTVSGNLAPVRRYMRS